MYKWLWTFSISISLCHEKRKNTIFNKINHKFYPQERGEVQTFMVSNCGISTIGQRAGTTIANPSHVIGIAAKVTSSDSATRYRTNWIKWMNENIPGKEWVERKNKVYLVMKLQWLCLMTCQMTSSCCISRPFFRRHCGLKELWFALDEGKRRCTGVKELRSYRRNERKGIQSFGGFRKFRVLWRSFESLTKNNLLFD